jgi:toxin ParE1/3/4
MKLRITRTAVRDVAEIWHYIALDSTDAADRVRNDLEAAMRKLAEMPGMGHQRTDVKNPAYRFWRVYAYLIAYRLEGQTLYISRVIHGARNLRRLFRAPPRPKR